MPPKQPIKKLPPSTDDNGASSSISLNDIAAKLDAMELRFDELPAKVSEEVSSRIEEVMGKISKCEEKVACLEKTTNAKLYRLEVENNILHRQLNRADVLLSGIPTQLTSMELFKVVQKIGEKFNVIISTSDINICNWVYNKNYVLVKFNQQLIKDTIMQEYFKTKDLKLSEVYDGALDLDSRVFLNNNLTPLASKLHYVCRKLRRSGKIKKFKVKNLELPKAVITLNNDDEETLYLEQLMLFYKKNAEVNVTGKSVVYGEEVNAGI